MTWDNGREGRRVWARWCYAPGRQARLGTVVLCPRTAVRLGAVVWVWEHVAFKAGFYPREGEPLLVYSKYSERG